VHPGRSLPGCHAGESEVDDLPQGWLHRRHPPPASITGKEKRLNAASYGYTGRMGDAEYDHLISLQLGDDPNDYRNLWVEPADPGHKPGAGVNNKKDPVETQQHTAVCAGQVTLAAAQRAIAGDWTTALSRLGLQ
jgi:hypothetical protein